MNCLRDSIRDYRKIPWDNSIKNFSNDHHFLLYLTLSLSLDDCLLVRKLWCWWSSLIVFISSFVSFANELKSLPCHNTALKAWGERRREKFNLSVIDWIFSYFFHRRKSSQKEVKELALLTMIKSNGKVFCLQFLKKDKLRGLQVGVKK